MSRSYKTSTISRVIPLSVETPPRNQSGQLQLQMRCLLPRLLPVFLLWTCLLCLFLGDRGFAQESVRGSSDKSNLPPAPQNYILDDAELFRENQAALSELQKSLSKMQNDYGYPVYLAIYYNVYDGNLQARADALLKNWTDESNHGMVIVYQLDPVISGNNPAIAFNQGSTLDDDLSKATPTNVISGRDVEAMLTRIFRNVEADRDDHTKLISSLIYGLEGEISKYYEAKPASWSDKDNLNLMAVFLGVILVLGILGVLFWRLFARADAKSNQTRYFPEVRVGRRLEAPFGGGWISEKTFVPASSRR